MARPVNHLESGRLFCLQRGGAASEIDDKVSLVPKVFPTPVLTALVAFFAAATLGAGCGGSPTAGDNGSGGGGPASSAGTGGGSAPAGSGGSAGGDDGSGGAPPADPNGFDDGKLFTDAGPPKSPPAPDAGPTDGSTGAEASGGPGMAVKMFPNLGISLSFKQTGADVTMVATHKSCKPFTIQIHGGFSCDNANTQGGIWDGQRGDGITGTVACDMATQIGTLTYTRSGADPTLNWTVGDHNAKTDLTYHPIFVDGNCLTFF